MQIFYVAASLGHVVMQTSQPVVFEDYLFYASLRRQEEEGSPHIPALSSETDAQEKNQQLSQDFEASTTGGLLLDEVERVSATRALRLSSWMSIFFLLTTDIFGPFGVPYAVSQVGWIPGVLLFVISSVFFFLLSLS